MIAALTAWKAGLTPTQLNIVLAIAAAAAVAGVWLAFHYLRRARIIEDTPTSKIRSAAQGYVELCGQVIGGEAGELIAPLSQHPCVWYRYKVQRWRESGKKGSWQTVQQGTSDAWFQINDGTGTCVIDPTGAEVHPEISRTWYSRSAIPGVQTNAGFLSAFDNDRYRYTEELILPHEMIYALGHFQTVGGGRNLPSSDAQTGEVIRQWKQDYDALLERFDANGDGQIDLQEWEAVRAAAQKEAERQRKSIAEAPAVNVLSRAPDRRYPFILSTHSQKTLAKRLRYYSAGTLAGGITAAGFALWLLS